jgi:tripartite-type tricarboxylate transporter receptor subunit TctC
MTSRRTLLAFAGGALAGQALAQGSHASTWPSRPIRLIVPLPPGGAYDFVGRMMAEHLRPLLDVPIVVENKFGAGARIGTEFVARAPADGYTFLVMASTHVVLPSMVQKLPYDAIRDFAPVSLMVDTPFVLAVNARMLAQDAREFIALARAKPGALAYGSSGTGSPFHLAGEMLKLMAHVDMLHVAYKGTGPLMNALLGGEVPAAFVPIGPYLPHFRAGKLRPLAVASRAQTSLLPNLPTLAQAVPLPGFGLDSWVGMAAPAGTPRPILDRMNAEIRKVLQDPQVRSTLLPQGYVPVASTPDELATAMKDGLASYARIVKDAGIQPE